MLLLTVPSKRTGSWGMIPKRDLRSWRPNAEMSMPSMMIFPPDGSTNRNKTWINVDFPPPVRPTTPIFSPPVMLMLIPLRTKGVSGRYLTCSSKNRANLQKHRYHSYKYDKNTLHVNYLHVFQLDISWHWPARRRDDILFPPFCFGWYHSELFYPLNWNHLIFHKATYVYSEI